MDDARFLAEAVALARENVAQGGGPFGALVVHAGVVIGRGANRVVATADPTAHAEILALRAACRSRGTHELGDATVYASCEPCPMCLGALYWARVARLCFAAPRSAAAAAGFDDERIYRELALPLAERAIETVHLSLADAAAPFRDWAALEGRVPY